MNDLACADLVELASAYLEDELPEPLALAVARHALTCPGCTLYVDQLIATVRALRSLGGVAR